jgi:S-formylglutathione hydrolase FrmB
MKPVLWLLGMMVFANAWAAKVDTLTIFSNSMQKDIRCVVVAPNSHHKTQRRFPVVYLLHGYSGNYANWVTKVPELQQYADAYQLLLVCPDGGYSSWYFDSPLDSTVRYETHIINEVVPYIDSRYPTIADRQHRAITGLSMGGHGSLFLAWRHADVFGACGSMSGGVDINASRLKFDISKRIGDTLTHADNWKRYTVIHLIDNPPTQPLGMLVDCGTKDFYYEVNRQLHQKLLRLGIAHDYVERPGQHDWSYWQNAVPYHLLFFRRFFDNRRP